MASDQCYFFWAICSSQRKWDSSSDTLSEAKLVNFRDTNLVKHRGELKRQRRSTCPISNTQREGM